MKIFTTRQMIDIMNAENRASTDRPKPMHGFVAMDLQKKVHVPNLKT